MAQGARSLEDVAALCADKAPGQAVQYVMDTVKKVSGGQYDIVYTPSLVRGQGYYTGMVFEITCPQFSGAVAGGGRYDNTIGAYG